MRILFTGGGTGGHIYPIIAVKSAFAKAVANTQAPEFLYMGPDGFAKDAFEKKRIRCKFILTGKLRRYFSLLTFIDLLKAPIGLIQSFWHVFWFMPDVIFSKGGYGSIPVVFIGWLYGIPIIIHESDSIPGLANKVLARFAKRIIVSFEEAKKYFPPRKTILLGIPIREELIKENKEEGKKLFGINSTKPVILIMGGSQGAQQINEIILNTLPRLLEKCEVIHICGKNNFKQIEAEYEKTKYYHPYPFLKINKLKHAYAVSDIIVSRAGATSIFEIAAVGKPNILIPLANAASDHQAKNAWALSRIGGTIILKEKNLTMNMFLDAVFDLIDNPEKAKQIGEKARSFYKPDANRKIAEEILKYVK